MRFSWLTLLLLCACPPKDVMGRLDPGLPDAATTQRPDTSRRAQVNRWALEAAVAIEREDYDHAEKALEWVRRLEPSDDPWPHVARGSLEERRSDWDAAIAAYQEALRDDESCGAAHLGLGRVMLGRGLPAAAIPHLGKAVELAPDSEGRELLVRAQVAEGDQEAARSALDGWLDAEETSLDVGIRQARAARKVGCEALEAFDVLIPRWETAAELLRVAAAAHSDCGASERAEELRVRADALEAP